MTHVSERYSRATSTSKLVMAPDHQSDIDVLTAAGWASAGGDPLALILWRMKHTGRPIGFHGVVSGLNDWARKESRRRKVRDAGAKTKFVIEKALYWWLHNVCGNCKGRGHPVFEGSPVVDDAYNCPECTGTGKLPLTAIVPKAHIEVAELVLAEVERQSASVFDHMNVALKG